MPNLKQHLLIWVIGIFLSDMSEISVLLSYRAGNGIVDVCACGNLITGCAAVVSDGTFNQKGNQKVMCL